VTALLLALASSASYGTSDFIASRATKRLSPVLLVLYSQAAQAVVLLVMVLALDLPRFRGHCSPWGEEGVHDAEDATAVPTAASGATD
jgi:drug/metabolite transporter (DMT)-like permease